MIEPPSESADQAIHRQVAQNLAQVRARIAAACQASNRLADEVHLVAVTKYVGLASIRALLAAGQLDLGESRVQQLMPRVEALSELSPRWHLIGHLQRNKVKYLLPEVRIIHSVDSLRLAEQISNFAEKKDCRVDIFVETNVSGESAKDGADPAELYPLLSDIGQLPAIEVIGLMTMAPKVEIAAETRPFFAKLRELRDAARENGCVSAGCRYLSMGMSGDFEAAIAEGATHVRVGSALFEGLSDEQRAQD